MQTEEEVETVYACTISDNQYVIDISEDRNWSRGRNTVLK